MQARMRLLWHLPSLSESGCGMSRRARNAAAGLRERGHDVTFFVARDSCRTHGEAIDDIPIQRVDAPPARTLHWSLQALSRSRRAAALARLMPADGTAVLTCQPEFAAAVKRHDEGMPVLLVACCSQRLYDAEHDRSRAGRSWLRRGPFLVNQRLLRQAEREGFRHADIVAFDSGMTRHIVTRAYALADERCIVVPPTVDTRRFRPAAALHREQMRRWFGVPSDGFCVAWTGRMDDAKNVEMLIDAVAIVRERISTLLLVGDGPLRPSLEARVRAHGIQRQVIFAGMQADVTPWLQASDAFVLPSRVESFGVAVIEAMSCGLPAIALRGGANGVRSGACQSIVNGETGFLLPEESPDELAERLKLLAADAGLRARMGRAARKRVETEFALGRDALRLEQAILAVVGGTADSGDTVSAVIPTYNSRSVLGHALDSICAQTHPVREVIVVDDGSTDGTAEFVREYRDACTGRAGPQVRYLHRTNAGPAAARNAGAAIARGEWLAFLDADDVWMPDKIAAQLTAAARAGADAVVTAVTQDDGARRQVVRYAGPTTRDALVTTLVRRNILTSGASTVLVRRAAFQSIGGFDPAFAVAEDRDFFIRLADRHRVTYLPRPLACRRTGPVRYGDDPERNLRGSQQILVSHAHRVLERRFGRLILREARARMRERAGMHYLHRGQVRPAVKELCRALALWPLLGNPWKALINLATGRRRYGERIA